MLLGNFFTITAMEIVGQDVKARLEINPDHKIFAGHFPGQPVVPGVCMMQMVKEIMEQVTATKLNIINAHEMKFLAVIDPSQNGQIEATLKYSRDADTEGITVVATLFKDVLVHFKFKGLLNPGNQIHTISETSV